MLAPTLILWRGQKINVGDNIVEADALEQWTQVQTAARPKLDLVHLTPPGRVRAESAEVVLQFALADAQRLISKLACQVQLSILIIATLIWLSLDRSFHSCIVQFCD